MSETLQREPVMASISENSGSAPSDRLHEAILAGPPEPLTIEQRLDKLERLYLNLKSPGELEERITTRVLERLPETMASPRWYQRINPFRKPAMPAASGWVVFDVLNEVRFVLTMLLDHRFSMSWISRGIVAAALAIAFTASFWLSPLSLIPLIGSTIRSILETLLILICGGFIFKIFHREILRYRGFLESMSS